MVLHTVLGIEHIFGHGNGPAKKQSATNAIEDAINIFATTAGTPGADSSMSAFVDDLIEATVKYFNSTGAMTHGSSKITGVTHWSSPHA